MVKIIGGRKQESPDGSFVRGDTGHDYTQEEMRRANISTAGAPGK
jgi:hypothetical protein